MEGLAVTPEVVRFVLVHAFLDGEVQRFCIRNLKPEFLMTAEEQPYRILWNCVSEYYSQHNRMPNTAEIGVLVNSRLAQAHFPVEFVLREIDPILELVEENPREELNQQTAIQLAKLIISRYYKEDFKEKLVRSNGDDAAFGKLFEEQYRQFKESTSYSTFRVEPYVPATLGELLDSGTSVPYNLPFVDAVMGGGCRQNEVYCLLGPTGGGKSLLSLQLVTEQSIYFHTGNLSPINVFFTYELSRADTMMRAYAQITEVALERLESIAQGRDQFTQEEAARYDLANHLLLDHFRIVDFSGTDPASSDAGIGTLMDAAEYLRKLQEFTGRPIGSVILDWAGLIVEREAIFKNLDITRTRVSELTSFVQRAKDIIAGPFSCSVWAVHQLAGEVTNKPAHVAMHHSQAQWCKGFANNAVYAMCLGNTDPDYRVMTFNCSKARRSKREPLRLLQISDSLRFVDVTNRYTVDKLYGIQPRDRL